MQEEEVDLRLLLDELGLADGVRAVQDLLGVAGKLGDTARRVVELDAEVVVSHSVSFPVGDLEFQRLKRLVLHVAFSLPHPRAKAVLGDGAKTSLVSDEDVEGVGGVAGWGDSRHRLIRHSKATRLELQAKTTVRGGVGKNRVNPDLINVSQRDIEGELHLVACVQVGGRPEGETKRKNGLVHQTKEEERRLFFYS